MADHEVSQFTPAQAQSLLEKLSQFADALEPGERSALESLLQRALLPETEAEGYALSGINALIAVTQMKTDNANQNALDGATKQRQGQGSSSILQLYPVQRLFP